jgi:6-phosphogluconolactonase
MSQTPTHRLIRVFDNPEGVAHAAAEKFLDYCQAAISDGGCFSVALAGGNTPRRVYELLASESFRDRIQWSRVHLFFGDERCVRPDHKDSNYGMVFASLISNVAIPPANVHRIIGEGSPHESAAEYERELKAFFGDRLWPQFDLVMLGLGEDGHTASLFPGSDATKEESKWVVATRNEQTKQDRITLTVPAINHARHVLFLVTGKTKAPRFANVSALVNNSDPLPAQLIQPQKGTLEWLVDKEAATL